MILVGCRGKRDEAAGRRDELALRVVDREFLDLFGAVSLNRTRRMTTRRRRKRTPSARIDTSSVLRASMQEPASRSRQDGGETQQRTLLLP